MSWGCGRTLSPCYTLAWGLGLQRRPTDRAPVRGAVGPVTRESVVTVVSVLERTVSDAVGDCAQERPGAGGVPLLSGWREPSMQRPAAGDRRSHPVLQESGPSSACWGESTRDPHTGFTLGLWKQTGLGLRLLPSSCVTLGE